LITEYHAKLFAHELRRRHSVADAEKLAGALLDAQVDLNPHQVAAALFAFKSPLAKGAILADEVGLGKTIEAGLVLAQKWTEGRRRILVITPANSDYSRSFLHERLRQRRTIGSLARNPLLGRGFCNCV
jgi:SNF2 family DNA or RNA helicase